MSERRRKLVLAIDCDDVLIPTAQVIVDTYNKTYGTNVSLDDLYTDRADLWEADTMEEASSRIDSLLRAGVAADAIPPEETILAVESLAKEGHEMHIVTGRQSYQEPITQRQIGTYYPGIFQTIEHTNMYASGGSAYMKRSKGQVCAALGAHVLVDDHIVHGEHVLAAGVEDVVLFGDYPWNRAESLQAGMVRCALWQDVVEEVGRVSRR